MAKRSAIKEHDDGRKTMTRCRIMKRRDEFGEKRVDRKGERIITGKEWGRREGEKGEK